MATPTASPKVDHSATPTGVWVAAVLFLVGVAVWWLMPAQWMVASGLMFVGLLAAVLVVLKRRMTPESLKDHDEAAPLHLRD